MTVVGHEREPATLGFSARYGKLVRQLAARTQGTPPRELAWALVETEMLRLHVRRRLSEQLVESAMAFVAEESPQRWRHLSGVADEAARLARATGIDPRTVVCAGKPSGKFRAVYDIVLTAQRTAEELLRAGMGGR